MPTITLQPTTTTDATAPVTVTGSGFAPKQRVRLRTDGYGTSVYRHRANSAGAFVVGAPPPVGTIGTHTVDVLNDQATTVLATANYTVVVSPPPSPSTTGWSAKPAFLSYPSSAAINITSGSDVEISAKSFRGIAYPTAAIRVSGVHNLWIHDVDADALNWDFVDILGCSGLIRIEWVRFRNLGASLIASPMGRPFADFIQFADTTASGYIANVKGVANLTEDLINFYQSGGPSATDRFEIRDFALQGTGWTSTSGTGMLLADISGGHIWAHNGTVLSTGQVGIGISMGTDVHVTDNIVYGAQRAGSNVGIYTPYVAGVPNPGGHEVARNRVFWLRPDGSPNPYWDGGASGVISGVSTNTFQDTTINPASLAVVL